MTILWPLIDLDSITSEWFYDIKFFLVGVGIVAQWGKPLPVMLAYHMRDVLNPVYCTDEPVLWQQTWESCGKWLKRLDPCPLHGKPGWNYRLF